MNKTMMTAMVTLSTALGAWAGDKDKKTHTVYVTNYVQVPVVCARLEMADVAFQPGHTYRLWVADGASAWRNWGTVRSGTNTNARIWFPLASTRPMAWQLVDVTPGYPQAALAKQAPDCTAKPQWVVLGLGNIRQVSQ